MKTINSDYDQQFHSPQFLHISQINKLISPLKHDRKQNLSPFTEPKKPKNHYQRLHSSTQKNYQEIYSPFSCELAFSAEKFISDAHKINNLQSKIIEKGFNLPDKKTLDPALRKKSFLLRKSRIFQGPPNKLIFLEKSDSKNNKNNLSHSSKGSFKIEENLNENVILQENTSEQSEIIWRYMNNNKRDTEEIQSIKKEWVQALTKEERGSKLYHKTMKVYGWHPKILSMQKLDNVIVF